MVVLSTFHTHIYLNFLPFLDPFPMLLFGWRLLGCSEYGGDGLWLQKTFLFRPNSWWSPPSKHSGVKCEQHSVLCSVGPCHFARVRRTFFGPDSSYFGIKWKFVQTHSSRSGVAAPSSNTSFGHAKRKAQNRVEITTIVV